MKILGLLIAMSFSVLPFAHGGSLSQLLVDGQIYKADGSALEAASVTFTFKVMDPLCQCLRALL